MFYKIDNNSINRRPSSVAKKKKKTSLDLSPLNTTLFRLNIRFHRTLIEQLPLLARAKVFLSPGAPSYIFPFSNCPGCDTHGCLEGRFTSCTEPVLFVQLAGEPLVVPGFRLSYSTGRMYLFADWIRFSWKQNRALGGRIGPRWRFQLSTNPFSLYGR